MFTNGSTAMDLAGTEAAGTPVADEPGVMVREFPCAPSAPRAATVPVAAGATRAYLQSSPPPTASTSAISNNSALLTRCRPFSPWYQASTSMIAKPTAIVANAICMTRCGQS